MGKDESVPVFVCNGVDDPEVRGHKSGCRVLGVGCRKREC
jgi:hypothetical protein